MISPPILSGDTITISAVSGHTIGYGQFHIENPGTATIEVRILHAELVIGDIRKELTPLHLLLENAEESIPADSFAVGQGAAMDFTISFPAMEANPYSAEEHAVHLAVQIGDQELDATSTIILQRRIPR